MGTEIFERAVKDGILRKDSSGAYVTPRHEDSEEKPKRGRPKKSEVEESA